MKSNAYLLQAILVAFWWAGLFMNKRFYDAFQFEEIGNTAFNAFLLPDLFIVVVLSTVRFFKPKPALEYVILGGFAFATLYCINATILTKSGFLSTIVMTVGLFYNLFLVRQKEILN